MARLEGMVAVAKAERIGRHLAGHERRRPLEARTIARAKHLASHHELESPQTRIGRALRIHVDELDYPVRIAPGGGGVEMRDRVSRYREVFGERLALVGQHVRTAVDEALICELPL